MRVYLKASDLESDAGKQLLDLTVRIALDGKLDLEEINALRAWLRANKKRKEDIHFLSVAWRIWAGRENCL